MPLFHSIKSSRIVSLSCLLALSLTGTLRASDSTYIPYPVDLKPMEKYPELNKEWKANKEQYADKVMPEPVLKRQLEIIESISAKESLWQDGLWMIADIAFQLGGSFSSEKDLPYARSIFVRGERAAEKCLQKQVDHPICELYLGAMTGKIASIDGIFTSLKKAKRVEKLWTDVTQSKYNYRFGEASSLQGNARYALGIFYRLIPDFFLMRWLFGVSGDIKKSVRYHREALALDPPNPCSKVMLAVSLLCAAKGDVKEPEGQEGLKHLREARLLTAKSMVAKACQNDTTRLEQSPAQACGYETARQQETSEDEFTKQQESQSRANAH